MSSPYASCPAQRSSTSPTVCEVRGYCGPFRDQDRFDTFSDRAWHGLAICRECGNTASVQLHEARRFNLLLLKSLFSV